MTNVKRNCHGRSPKNAQDGGKNWNGLHLGENSLVSVSSFGVILPLPRGSKLTDSQCKRYLDQATRITCFKSEARAMVLPAAEIR